MKASKWVCGAALTLVSGSAFAICESNPTTACMRAALEGADQQLNFVFRQLLVTATPDASNQIRASQRDWLRLRNTRCELLPSNTAAADWLVKLAEDKTKATCVYDTTTSRVAELRDRPTANNADEYVEKTEYSFPASRSSGKLYSEVRLNVKGADKGPATSIVQIGVADAKSFVGVQIDPAKAATKALPNGDYVVGLAIDLDNGKLYSSDNGQWRATPGSLEGSDIRRGAPYSLHVSTPGRLLSKFIQLNVVRINTGNEPFQFATPPGYEPYYKAPSNVSGGSRLDWVVPIYQKVANQGLSYWAERYWAWLLVKSPERSPVTDTTGAYCGDAQAGPVWFLASADAKNHIVRSCTVPSGKFILMPAVANLIQSATGNNPCSKIEAEDLPQKGVDSIESVYVTIDGQRFDSFYDNRVHTKNCYTIRGPAGETVARDVVFFGAWIMLRPLPPGDHTISFGGKLEALQVNRDVTYKLTVQ